MSRARPPLRQRNRPISACRRRVSCWSSRTRRTPGVEAGSIDLTAERPGGTSTRQVFLGETLDADNISADYTAGVLTLAIPVREAAKPRKVTVTSQDAKQLSST